MPPVDHRPSSRRWFRRVAALTSGAVLATVALFGLSTSPAVADAAPLSPETVTADALPTWQINGVVWSQAVVGTTVYATGSFTKARPPGVAAGGAGEVDAPNLFAFDIRTGNPVPFPHSLNYQGLVVQASPDGTQLYVGGDFTTVDGQPRNHIAAFDLATGALVSTPSQPSTDGQVRGLGFAGSTLYVGGNFRSAGGQARKLLAAFDTTTGAMTSWSPTVDDGYVWSMAMAPNGSRVIVGGSFTTLNGVSAYGMGALDASTGATGAWAANSRIHTGGKDGAITSLRSDGTQIYGSGYAFGAGAAFEGTFAADPYTGAINWVNDCLGDTYDVFPMGQVLYNVSHRHNCSAIDGFPDTNPRSRWIKAAADRTFPIGTLTKKDAYGWDFTGLQYSGLLHWYPDLEFGTYTSSKQAAWSITGTSDYLVLGGEFPIVNGVAQQGLVRFAKRTIAPHVKGPVINTAFTPAPSSTESGKVTGAFSSAWDRDGSTMSYDVYRSPGTRIATFLRSDSEFWKLPTLSFSDTQAPGASVRYQVRATDSDGNVQWSAWSPYITVSSAAPTAYTSAIRQSGAAHLWRLNDPSGAFLLDSVGTLHGRNAGMTLGAAGAVTNETSTAVTSPGGSTASINTDNPSASDPATTVEAWVKTTSVRGGRVVGFGDSDTGTSTSGVTDRVLYLDNSGRVNFAINDGSYRTIYGRTAVNDGQWHQLVGTVDAGGMQLFVDGVRVGRDQNFTAPKAYSGYWRIGADQTSGFANKPTDAGLAGSIDEVAVYPTALTKTDIQKHYTVSGRTAKWSAAPTDAYGAQVAGAGPDLYWRFGEASGAAVDSSSSGQNGTVNGTLTRGQAGPISGNTSGGFDGTSTLVVAPQSVNSPRVYTEELWFKTSSTKGGKLIGFGNATSGISTSDDRHVIMYSDGKLSFGTYTGVKNTLVTTGSYNNGQWHHLVASQGPEGMRLWVDTKLVGSNAVSGAQSYLGYWRVGGDVTWGNTLSNYISGNLDEVAVYPRVLAEQEIRDHYTTSGRAALNRPPVAAFTTALNNLQLTADGSTSKDPDGPITYAWTFGDGATATTVKPSHTYAQAGTYQVKLTVTDAQGLTSSTTQTVTAVANKAPVAAFTATPTGLDLAVDGSTSTDSDGTVAGYGWDFGDGFTTTGKTATHTYGQSGSFVVKLTATDDDGATSSATQTVTVTQPANQPPQAAFSTSTEHLVATLDASGSKDPDGTLASYAWDFGDGSTGSGATVSHPYAEAGTYSVQLTVTDNRGGTDSVTHDVTVAANEAPAASFASQADDLTITVDGSDSADADGSVQSYAWDFGDGGTGSSKTVTHTFAKAGDYDVQLTVTDNDGAKDTATKTVTVTAPTVLARDDFGRAVTGGWGSADKGGSWSIPSGASKFNVADGAGTVTLAANAGATASLNAVSTTDSDTRVSVSIDKVATGGGQYLSVIGRQVDGVGDYRAKVRVSSTGAVAIWLTKMVGGTETVFTSVTVPGLTYAVSDTLNLRLQVSGSTSTSLKVKAWKNSAAEPAAWSLATTDSTSALQAPGAVAFYTFLSSSTTNGPVVFSYDKLLVGPTQ